MKQQGKKGATTCFTPVKERGGVGGGGREGGGGGGHSTFL